MVPTGELNDQDRRARTTTTSLGQSTQMVISTAASATVSTFPTDNFILRYGNTYIDKLVKFSVY